MAQIPVPNVTDELELPPLDGEGEDDDAKVTATVDEVDVHEDADPYDDSEGVALPDEPLETATDEVSAVGDDDTGFANATDEPVDDGDGASLLGDDDSPGVAGEDFDIREGDDVPRDMGEEGFDAPEPELRVEDLPRLDEGTDDDLSIEEAADAVIAPHELRWDDRGYERVRTHAFGHVVRIAIHASLLVALEDGSMKRSVDGGETFIAADEADEEDEALVVRGRARALWREGVGVLRAIDDGPLVLVESTAEATAFTLLDDGSLLFAMDGPDRARVVRVGTNGAASVVAEEDGSIEALAVDIRSGLVWAGGTFGLAAYRPR